VRCPRCGNENPGTNRFCGMCGATLLPATTPAQTAPISTQSPPGSVTAASGRPSSQPPAVTYPTPIPSAPAQNATAPRSTFPTAEPRTPEAPRPGSRPESSRSEPRPSISGPSFLGLNNPPPRKRASLSIDPSNLDPQSAPTSSNLDYLLEDEEEPRRGGAGKFVLIVVALSLAVGLGYLRWKNQSFGWLNSGSSKPAPATQTSDAPDSNAPAASSSPSPSPTTQTPSQPADSAPSPTNSSANPAPDGVPGGAPPAAATPAGDTPGGTNPAVASTPPAIAKDASAETPDSPPVAAPKPKPAPVEAPPKPTPVRGVDPVTEAQKYLYGKGGVHQDCEHGLRILKPAADHANPKAMIEMGALYSAGLCTPHDLPTAYRWFALALRKDPNNQSVQTDLQKLWGEMTQPERQLAIKLSQ
jgi:hypothetical protein